MTLLFGPRIAPIVREVNGRIAHAVGGFDGASERDRTSDLLITNQLL